MKSKSAVSDQILKALIEHPEGLDIQEIRSVLKIEGQQHLDRRLRDLDKVYEIKRVRRGIKTKYVYVGLKPKKLRQEADLISTTLRAQVMHAAGGKCGMCGSTVARENIQLHVDHKLPLSWGGTSSAQNLWAICSACNLGKKNYFSSFPSELMKELSKYESVHERIYRLLHAKRGEWVDCDLIEFVANSIEYQTDWKKRLRELRVIGAKILTRKVRRDRRTISEYKLTNSIDIPKNFRRAISKVEKSRGY